MTSLTGRLIGRIVALCARHAILTVVLGLLLGAAAATYAAGHFAMTTDTGELLSPKLAWRQHERVFDRAFPQQGDSIVAVIDGRTPELTQQAARSLAAALQARHDIFPVVRRPDGGDFFDREGLLYLSTPEVQASTAQLIKAQPFLAALAADPSLRGVAASLSTAAQGVTSGSAQLADLQKPMTAIAPVVEQVQAGRPAFFSWRALFSDTPPGSRDLRALIVVQPRLDFSKLEPGSDASSFIRQAAHGLNIDAAHGARLRLTGEIPLQDEEFATLAQGIWLITGAMVASVVLMIWLAVRSKRLVGCVLATTLLGLTCAAALGLMIFGRFNVISVAFIPLFVGLGVDFGIQVSVRFRAEHLVHEDIVTALNETGLGMGRSLVLAAAAIAVGFLSFAPTSYVGVSQLGVIAGLGMLIALALNLTVLPALIRLVRPSGRRVDPGFALAEVADRVVVRHRRPVLVGAAVAALACACLMPLVRFDFNPLHLRSPKVESMAALADLMKDPDRSPNTIDVLTPTLANADARAARLRTLPEVGEAVTLSSFVPDQQAQKLAVIRDAADLIGPSLDPFIPPVAPTDQEVVASLGQAAADLDAAAAHATGASSTAARRLAADLRRLASGPAPARARAAEALIPPLRVTLDEAKASLQAQPVTLASLPRPLAADWVNAQGQARISVLPKGNANDNAVLHRFTGAVLKLEPDATGTPLSIQLSGATMVQAFAEAGVLSFVAISLLLLAVLRRVKDVVVTMTPVILTGLLTLGTCVVIGQPINFANIIALPLLFGIGVAFHIYFVMAWRAGGSHLLQSSLARAIFFSAMTTATGFGSLWLSSHPGTASMGKLLMISLVWTLVTALLFQPALMGRPRDAPPEAV